MPDSALDSIFKAYDVRGIYPDELDESIARRIGNAFVAFTGSARVLVGRDARPSSEPLVAAFTEGAIDRRRRRRRSRDGVHRPLLLRRRQPRRPGRDVHRQPQPGRVQRREAVPGRRRCPSGRTPGWPRSRRWSPAGCSSGPKTRAAPSRATCCPAFVAHVHSFVDLDALGAAARRRRHRQRRRWGDRARGVRRSAVRVLAPLRRARRHVPEPPGRSHQHRQPQGPPARGARRRRRAWVSRSTATPTASCSSTTRRSRCPGPPPPRCSRRRSCAGTRARQVVHNLICSKAVPEVVRELGGTPIRTRVGHSFIKQVMAETGAVFGGEHSAHYYFRDNYRADSGIIAALLVLEQLSTTGQPLSELRMPFERYAMSGEINTRVDDPARCDRARRRHLRRRRAGPARRSHRRLRRLVVQPASEQHRAAAPAQPGSGRPRRLRRAHRRGPRARAGHVVTDHAHRTARQNTPEESRWRWTRSCSRSSRAPRTRARCSTSRTSRRSTTRA